MKDYYSILEIPKTAAQEEIKKAYRKLARKYHPDINKESGAEDKFKEINEAYGILGDEASRNKYDAKLNNNFTSNTSKASKTKTGRKETSNGTIEFDNIEESFENFFGFNPKTKEKVLKKEKSKNPLDTTDMFEKFFGVGKK